jgi:hypothetical protein
VNETWPQRGFSKEEFVLEVQFSASALKRATSGSATFIRHTVARLRRSRNETADASLVEQSDASLAEEIAGVILAKAEARGLIKKDNVQSLDEHYSFVEAEGSPEDKDFEETQSIDEGL